MVVANAGSQLTDSEEILQRLVDGTAALAPLGGGPGDEMAGYKGYGYAAVVEILSAALAGGKFMKALTGVAPDGSPQMYHLGHFFFVIDPDAFCGRDTFAKIAGDICRELRASRKAPGYDRILTAGEREWLAWQERKDKGVPVGKTVQAEILAVRDRLGLPYEFPFE
jgi:LDH2 family malate/lactate/ureidoglycolate dehydrogenase